MGSSDSVRSTAWPRRAIQIIGSRHTTCCGVVALLLIAGSAIVYATGGTAYAYPYLMLIPVLVAASWYTTPGGLIAALLAGAMMATMPQDAALGIEQTTANYLTRLAFYLLLGGLAGWLFHIRRRSANEHRLIARTDPQSGLPNQVALNEDLDHCLSQPVGQVSQTGVIKVKITDMTDVVEALGMDAADELVLAMGERLSRVIRGGGKAYRLSLDELALILKDVGPGDLGHISQRLMDVGEDSLLIQQVPVRVQLAMGSAIARDGSTGAKELLREARIALLATMRQRRGHTHFNPSFDRRTLESLKLIARVRDGLAAREFELHYQPKIRLADGKVCGCEGLIRWRGANGRLIPPGQFMPKVENTSLIGPVTHFVAKAAGAFAIHDGSVGAISINVSVHDLHNEELHDLLLELVEHSGVRPERLEVEITESALIGDLEAARSAIQRIRDIGIGVSIDDFGTGFSSFEYLQHLPITGLKIDRVFVSHLERDERARKLMACMIDVGHALDLVVTAEGVETVEQAAILRSLGCDQAQGFLYSPALPATEYHAWCQRHSKDRDHD